MAFSQLVAVDDTVLTKEDGNLVRKKLVATLFVPMTGESEALRRIKPDPRNPRVVNGDFEMDENEDGRVDGWHYQRQVELVSDDPIKGSKCLRFTNDSDGISQVLQGGTADGRYVAALDLSVWARTESVIPGETRQDFAGVVIHFYDGIRREVGSQIAARWRGTENWQQTRVRIRVPPGAREMVMRVGLNGARGTLDVDDLRIVAVPR